MVTPPSLRYLKRNNVKIYCTIRITEWPFNHDKIILYLNAKEAVLFHFAKRTLGSSGDSVLVWFVVYIFIVELEPS